MNERDVNLLQLFYAGALIDATRNYAEQGILQPVTDKKRNEQALTAGSQLSRIGATNPSELLERMKEIFGCTDWEVLFKDDTTTKASTKKCLMCALAKKLGTAKPCDLFCINPMAGFAEAMTPEYHLQVDKTMWEEDECVFVFNK